MKYRSKVYYFAGLVLGLLVFCPITYAADAVPKTLEQNEILGILEDVPGVYAGEPNARKVRVAFQKDDQEWKAFPTQAELTGKCFNDCNTQFSCGNKETCGSASNINQCKADKLEHCNACGSDCAKKTLAALVLPYPAEVNWTIAFNGKELGQITSHTQETLKFYSHVGLQDITSKITIPTIGKKSTDYSGYLHDAVYRPLIANSQPYFKDPESWKRSKILPDLAKLVRQQFRQKFSAVENCANPDENIGRPWPYKDSDIKITKTYSSNNGWTITQVRLSESRCDYTNDDAFYDQWFAISPTKEITFLDKGMWLVDAGDYDNDGKSELVFAIDRENRGGYELFYDDFKKHSIFEFGYH